MKGREDLWGQKRPTSVKYFIGLLFPELSLSLVIAGYPLSYIAPLFFLQVGTPFAIK